MTTPDPQPSSVPPPQLNAAQSITDAAFELVALCKKRYPVEGSPEFFALTDAVHKLECACLAHKAELLSAPSVEAKLPDRGAALREARAAFVFFEQAFEGLKGHPHDPEFQHDAQSCLDQLRAALSAAPSGVSHGVREETEAQKCLGLLLATIADDGLTKRLMTPEFQARCESALATLASPEPGQVTDTQRMNFLRDGCTLWKLAGNAGWELTTKAGDFKGATLDEAITAAMSSPEQRKEGKP